MPSTSICSVQEMRRAKIQIARQISPSGLGLTVNRLNQMFWEFFVSLNGSAVPVQRGNRISRGKNRTDRGERCAASGAFNGSSPTANFVSIIKGKGSRESDSWQSEAPRRASNASFESIN